MLNKVILLASLVLSQPLLANINNCCPSVSGSCFNELRSSARCDNVADACYREMRASNASPAQAADACRNVSSSCFIQLRKERRELSYVRRLCENVSSNCFTDYFSNGFSSIESVKFCSDVVNCDF